MNMLPFLDASRPSRTSLAIEPAPTVKPLAGLEAPSPFEPRNSLPFLMTERSAWGTSHVSIECGNYLLEGELDMPAHACGVVIFVHDGASNRHGPRSQVIARTLRAAGLGTLLFDLLTHEERWRQTMTGSPLSNVKLLADRLIAATRWVQEHWRTSGLEIAYFGAGTGTAVALTAAAQLQDAVCAIVSRGGRPDLAPQALRKVKTPTLFVVGGCDDTVICSNGDAFVQLRCEKAFRIVPGATHLFEEAGKLEELAHISSRWLLGHLRVAADR
jgi:pimeloyl-ACP methyl ester carboxylesterase